MQCGGRMLRCPLWIPDGWAAAKCSFCTQFGTKLESGDLVSNCFKYSTSRDSGIKQLPSWNALNESMEGTDVQTLAGTPPLIYLPSLSAHETPSFHTAHQKALIPAHLAPASPPPIRLLAGSSHPVCPGRPQVNLFPGKACNPSPVRRVQCTYLGSDPVYSLSSCPIHELRPLGPHTNLISPADKVCAACSTLNCRLPPQ